MTTDISGYASYDTDNMSTLFALLLDRLYAIRADGLAETNLTTVHGPVSRCLSALTAGLSKFCEENPLPLGISFSVRQVENGTTHQVGGVVDLCRDSDLMPVVEFKSFAREMHPKMLDVMNWTIVNRGSNPNQAILGIDDHNLIDGAESFAAAFNPHLNDDIEVFLHDSMRNQTVLRAKLDKLTIQHPPPKHQNNLVLRGFISDINYGKPSLKFVRENNAGTVTIECPKPELVMRHLSLLASWSSSVELMVSAAEYQNSKKSKPDLKLKLLEIKAVKEFDANEIVDNLEVVAKSLAKLSITPDEWNKKSRKDKIETRSSPKTSPDSKRKK